MLSFEVIPMLCAKRHDGAHVGLVERGQDGRRVLSVLETLGNAPAQSGHRDATLALAHTGGLRRCSYVGLRCGRSGRRTILDKGQHVALQDAAILARTVYGCWIQTVFVDQASYGR